MLGARISRASSSPSLGYKVAGLHSVRSLVRSARASRSPAIPPKLGAECSNPGSCSSRLRSKLSPPFSGPRKTATAAGIRTTGLGFGERNVPPNRSPNAGLSPELESRPFYSTSFLASGFSGLASFASRKVGIPFACHSRRWRDQSIDRPPTLCAQIHRSRLRYWQCHWNGCRLGLLANRRQLRV